jgi:RNA polymerase sigma-70 factor (ECF subfamily)
MQDKRCPDIDVEEFYTRYGPMVLRHCRKLLKDEDKSMDAVQDTFTKVLLNRDRLTGQYPSSLLFRIATNTCLNMIRAEKKRTGEGEEDILINIAQYDEKEDRLIVTDLLDRIFKREKKSTREIAVMYYVDGMTYQDVARAVGLSVSGVRKRLRELRSRVNIDHQGGRL